MFSCTYCSFFSTSLIGYVKHFAFHRNIHNVNFPCPISGCPRFFKNYNSFKCHMNRNHSCMSSKSKSSKAVVTELTCLHCKNSFENVEGLLRDIKSHMAAGISMVCPYIDCVSVFCNKSSFVSHLRRKHTGKGTSTSYLLQTADDSEFVDSDQVLSSNLESNSNVEFPSVSSDKESPSFIDSNQDLLKNVEKNLALFYLKLQVEYFISSSTIQIIINEYQEMKDFDLSYIKDQLKSTLSVSNLSLSQEQLEGVIEIVEKSDMFSFFNLTSLRSDNTRKNYYKTNFHYVEPLQIYLGKNKSQRYCYAYYVPLKETLKSLFSDKSVHMQSAAFSNRNVKAGELSDINSGKIFKNIDLFRNFPESLKIILYQDSFEVVNPLGSARKKYKILAVYLTLGNLEPHCRLNVNNIQLVLLCKESDFRYFGQDKVFSHLVSDLKDIEDNGIAIIEDNPSVKGALYAVIGDNLGSHGIGGFLENFNCHYFCRYCLITSMEFYANPLTIGTKRNPDNYNSAVSSIIDSSVSGIKFNSVLNQLRYYHVCRPGLPPCLAHDIFEGVLSYDLSLYIEYFVKVQNLFSYEELNYMVSSFKYLENDSRNKPNVISSVGDKLHGHAVQNWCLLKLFPLIFHTFKGRVNENIWKLVLQLREIVEIVCAPKIMDCQIAYLKSLIEDYIDLRRESFPDSPLKPKHHYLLHYPDLIYQFGPLMQVSTLRFESKHTFFKKCTRVAQNFKNLCSTLANRHQLQQAYVSAGNRFSNIIIDSSMQFHSDLYNDDVQCSVAEHNFKPENTIITYKLTFKGTLYKKGLYLILRKTEEYLEMGKILMIIIKESSLVVFVVNKCYATLSMDMGIYNITEESKDIISIKIEDLLDYYPLPAYQIDNELHVPLHHAFCESF